MRTIFAAALAVLLLGACAPGTYTVSYLEWESGGAGVPNVGHVERPDREPRDPEVGHPTIPSPEPPVVRPEPPVLPPVLPPAPEPPTDPYAGCRIKELPPDQRERTHHQVSRPTGHRHQTTLRGGDPPSSAAA